MNDENELNELNPPVMDGYTKIPTFKLWVANNFPYMETDFDGITNYDLIGALTNYLNNVIKNEENVESNVAKLNQAYLELFTYVKDYFDNLDVQEEINNKLDEMVEDGTLQEIITSYLNTNALFTYNTIADLKLATNLIAGSKVKTLGFHSLNDLGGASYFIRVKETDEVANEITTIELNNGLIAELIIKAEMNLEQYGIVGDGITDETEKFQMAIDTIAIKGGILRLANKTYCVRTITLKSNVNLVGCGFNSIIKGHSNATAEEFRIIKVFSNGSNSKISNLKIDVNSDERTNITANDIGINIQDANDVEIDSVYIKGGNSTNAYCLRVGSTQTRPENINIHNSVFEVINNGFNGIAITSGNHIYCRDNTIYNINGGRGFCIDVEANTTEDLTLDRYRINDVILENNRCYGSNISIHGKTNPYSGNIIVRDNYINITGTATKEGLSISDISDVTVDNNTIIYNPDNSTYEDTSYYVFRLRGRNIKVLNNTIDILTDCFSIFRSIGRNGIVGELGSGNILIKNNNVKTNSMRLNSFLQFNIDGKINIDSNIFEETNTTYGIDIIGDTNIKTGEAEISNNNILVSNARGIVVTHFNKVNIHNNNIRSNRNNIEDCNYVNINNNIFNHSTSSYPLFEKEIYELNTNVNYNNNIVYGSTNGGNYANTPRISSGTYYPSTGYWTRGSIILNSAPTSSDTNPFAWICTETGTPGTWKPLV